MQVAVIGGGASGSAIARALVERGADVELMSRSSGFDVLRDDATERLRDADVVVEATGRFTLSGRVATELFTGSTRAVASAVRGSGARHVLLSIVGCSLPELQGFGYYAGKTAQEQVAREESERLTIVRSTQWFEFPGQNLERLRFGPISFVPQMRIKPVALDAVADVVAECATGARSGQVHDVAGPEVMTLWDMTTQLPRSGVRPVPLPMPGTTGRAFRRGALVPGDGAEVVGPRFAQWLGSRAA